MFSRLSALFLLVLIGCGSDDPRLPQQLYDDAVKLNQEGKTLEAKSLMDQVANRFPETQPGKQAKKDLYILEALLRQDLAERQKSVKLLLRRTADALTRYYARKGEYPTHLEALAPDYMEQVPQTPWGHPLFYRPYVSKPIEDVKDRRGNMSQRFNSRLDAYQLACLGTDLRPGGEDLAQDMLVVNGEVWKERTLPPIPLPQPVR